MCCGIDQGKSRDPIEPIAAAFQLLLPHRVGGGGSRRGGRRSRIPDSKLRETRRRGPTLLITARNLRGAGDPAFADPFLQLEQRDRAVFIAVNADDLVGGIHG